MRYYSCNMTSATPPQPLDFSAYQKPLTWFTVLQEALGKWALPAVVLGSISFVAVGTILLLSMISDASTDFSAVLLFFALFLGIPLFGFRGPFKRQMARAQQAMRLRDFAPANGFVYQPAYNTRTLPGLLFTDSNSDSSFETVVSGTYHNMPFLFGNACFVTGSGKSRTETWYGIVQVGLTRRVPHVLLDSKHNNSWFMSNFPNVQRSQRLRLEGDFNDYFDLYVPKGYERDALYFITPELMALLIDHGAKFDVELVDDNLIIYSSRVFALEKAEGVSGVFQMIDRIGAEFQENTQRYADANVGNRAANTVAEPGRRLKQSWPWIMVFMIILGFILSIIFD